MSISFVLPTTHHSRLLADSVALFVALGGGWWNAGENVPGNNPARDDVQLPLEKAVNP